MKKTMQKMLLALLMGCCTLLSYAQQRTVTGTVTDETGQPVAGATVAVKGSNIATASADDGSYSIRIDNNTTVLEVSAVGFITKEAAVGSNSTINFTILRENTKSEDEVVVTALGIKREKKALGYAFQEVKGETLLERREANITNALTGQVAGLQVIRGSNGPAGSSKLVLRGFNSLTGSNQPLIVVDGIPMDNFVGATNNDYWNPSTDMGNGLADLNPDDIESLSVLKGGAASALYGSRAGNGVILITTKKGTKKAGAGITYSATFGLETLFMEPELQSSFGQGSYGSYIVNNTDSWGPKIEGQSYKKWDSSTAQMRAYDNIREFFRTGFNTSHNLSFQQQISPNTSIYSSGTYFVDNSRIPGAKLERLNLTTRAVSNFGDNKRWTTDFKVQYMNNKANNRPLSGNNSNNYFYTVLQLPRSFDVRDLSPGTDENGNHFYWLPRDQSSAVNPYWAVDNNINQDSRDRFLLNGSVKYKFTDWLAAELRGGADIFNTKSETKLYASSPILANGRYAYGSNAFIEKNFIGSLTATKDNLIGKLGGSLAVYGQMMQSDRKYLEANSGELEVPNLFSVNNGKNPASVTQIFEKKQINSVFSAAEINYDGFWFLNFTARNDWSSSLSKKNRSYFYPSISTSLVITDMINRSGGQTPSWLSFTKVRAQYATTGNDLPPYQLYNNYSIGKDPNGNTTAGRENTLNNENIVSELIRNFEVGLESKFFKNRFGIDLTYYKQNATNQILRIPMNPLSGYQYRRVNAGNIQNSGVEIVLNARPVEGENFRWDMMFNYARNKNKIVDLYEDVNVYTLLGFDNVQVNAVKGGNYGDIWGLKYRRVEDVNDANYGKLLLTDGGLPQAATQSTHLGNQLPKAILGLSNTFAYKNFTFSFLVDGRIGGDIFSATNLFLQSSGLAAQTAPNGQREKFVVDGVVQDPANPGKYIANTKAVEVQDYWNAIHIGNLGITEANMYDATNIRLRNIAFNYSLPQSLLKKSVLQRAKVGFSINNVWMIKSNLNGIDPESVFATGSNAIGFEFFAPPTGRSYFLNFLFGF